MKHLLVITDEVEDVLLQLQQHHSVPNDEGLVRHRFTASAAPI